MPINCGIWRYHPEKELFEVVCHGTTNPWGMDWTEEGELLFSNTVIGHLWHVFPGAHFERMYGEDLKPHLYHLIGQAADHFHWHTAENWSDIRRGMTAATDSAGGGHAHCGLLIYQADNWPKEYHGKALMLNLHGRRINCDRLEPLGSSFIARHEPDVLRIDDPWFRGVDLQLGPDGAVWIADWCDVGECHENDGVHRNSGRIFRVWYGPAPKPRLPVWNNLTAEELLDWLQSPNAWHVGQVLAELARRRAEGGPMPSAEQFGRKFQVTKDPVQQVRLLWASYRAGRLAADQCRQLVAHDQPAVRCWAWRLLLEEQPPEQLVPLVNERLDSETHPRVAVTMLGVLPGLDSKNFWNVARRFARQSQWEGDKFFGPLLWYHIADRVGKDPEAAAGFLHDCALRNVRRWVARRLAEDWTVLMPVLSGLAHRMRTTADADWTEDVLAGWSDGLAGRRRVQAPANWGEVIERWSGSERASVQTYLRELSVLFGDGQAVSALLALAQDDQAPLDRRRRALATLVAARQPQVRPVLIALLDHRDLAADAIRGLAVWADGDWMEPLLGRFERLRPEAQNALISACVVRAASACRLLKAVKEGKVAPRHIQAFHLQQLRQLHDDEVTRLLEEIWPSQTVRLDRQQLLDFYEKELAPARLQEADWRKGAEVFRRACASCHKLFGQGGSVGPDLTGGQRHNLRYWLENILEPSAQVAENFRASTLLLADGRVLVGIIVERSQETLTVQTATDRVRLATEEVEQILPSALSLMPERLLDSLAPDEIRHLFAYLMKDAWDGHEPQNP
ncbi:MAG: hypothetical protein KatS3mg110_2432 [Pirellulaceae bacterium]|nr:MAG: hypothetical protein KatS3mg110_2432 [Pirellulaceae bacterium]